MRAIWEGVGKGRACRFGSDIRGWEVNMEMGKATKKMKRNTHISMGPPTPLLAILQLPRAMRRRHANRINHIGLDGRIILNL